MMLLAVVNSAFASKRPLEGGFVSGGHLGGYIIYYILLILLLL